MNEAHLHLFMVHFPIVGLILITPVFFYALFKKDYRILKLTLLLIFVISLTGVAAFVSGEGAEEIVEHYPSISEENIHEHEEAGEWAFRMLIATGFVSIVLLGMNFMPAGKNRFYYFLLSALLLISLTASIRTGQLGSHIRHEQEIHFDDTIAQPAENEKH